MKGLFITGTDTGVGKTHVASALARELRKRGCCVRVRKPVESGCEPSADGLSPLDAIALREAAGGTDPLERVCPVRLEAPVSPHRAARLENKVLSLGMLHEACVRDLSADDLVLVEGAGGFYSPIAEDGLNADLAQRIGLPLLLVVADRLGCLNQALLTIEAARHRGLLIAALALSQPEPPTTASMDNLHDLEELARIPLVLFPNAAADEDDEHPQRRLYETLAPMLGLRCT